jgi:hypothetical protein
LSFFGWGQQSTLFLFHTSQVFFIRHGVILRFWFWFFFFDHSGRFLISFEFRVLFFVAGGSFAIFFVHHGHLRVFDGFCIDFIATPIVGTPAVLFDFFAASRSRSSVVGAFAFASRGTTRTFRIPIVVFGSLAVGI